MYCWGCLFREGSGFLQSIDGTKSHGAREVKKWPVSEFPPRSCGKRPQRRGLCAGLKHLIAGWSPLCILVASPGSGGETRTGECSAPRGGPTCGEMYRRGGRFLPNVPVRPVTRSCRCDWRNDVILRGPRANGCVRGARGGACAHGWVGAGVLTTYRASQVEV